MISKDISSEAWRDYKWIIPETGAQRSVHILHPLKLYCEKGGSCHVVTAKAGESDITAYCVPAVGRFGCVLTWGNIDGKDPVVFASASKPD